MEEMEKYLDALEAAVAAHNRKALDLLDGFSAYVYHEVYARANETSGDERALWDGLLKRVQSLIGRMAKASPSIWL